MNHEDSAGVVWRMVTRPDLSIELLMKLVSHEDVAVSNKARINLVNRLVNEIKI